MTLDFKEFCNRWNDICLNSSADEKGVRFEEYFLENVMLPFIPKGCRTMKQTKMKGIDYKFDFLIVKSNAIEYQGIAPRDVLSAFEVKSHGFYSQPNIERVKFAFETIQRAYPQIKLFYVTYRETNYYDRKARSFFGSQAGWYYRLSDSGDGIQIPPKSYYSNEWKRLLEDLSS